MFSSTSAFTGGSYGGVRLLLWLRDVLGGGGGGGGSDDDLGWGTDIAYENELCQHKI